MSQDRPPAAAASAAAFDYHLFGTHVCFGDGVSALILKELDALGCFRPAILAQDAMARSAAFEALSACWNGLDHLRLPAVPRHSSVDVVETMAEKVRAFGADSLIAIGGGSVADTAKALALLLAEGGRLADHVTTFEPPSTVRIPRRVRPQLPIIGIPTTASGAEATSSFGVRREDGHKLMFWNRRVAAATLLIDPRLSADQPVALLRDSAMNGIAHALEALYSRGCSPVSDCIAVQAIRLFDAALDGASLAGHDARGAILQAAHLAGLALSMARSCLHHAICHVVASRQSCRTAPSTARSCRMRWPSTKRWRPTHCGPRSTRSTSGRAGPTPRCRPGCAASSCATPCRRGCRSWAWQPTRWRPWPAM